MSRGPLRIADVSADAILLAGGARAILLQLANPSVGHAIAEHSDFASRHLDRLRGTLTYLYVTVYGTAEEAHRVARAVGAAHAPVQSSTYSAADPVLQLWVAATLYETATQVRALVYGAISSSDAESLLADYAVVATSLGVPRELWPTDRASFDAYWSRAVSELRVDEVTRRVALALLHPRTGPLWLRGAMPTVRLFTAGLLTPSLRDAYGIIHNARRFERVISFIRVVYPRMPRLIRHAPKRYYLRKFRRAATASRSAQS